LNVQNGPHFGEIGLNLTAEMGTRRWAGNGPQRRWRGHRGRGSGLI